MASRKIKTFEDANSLLAEWAEIERNKCLPMCEDETCQGDFARMIGSSADKAARILEGYVKAGTWTKRDALVHGKRGIAYKPKGKPREHK